MRLRTMLILMAALAACACERDPAGTDGGSDPGVDSGPLPDGSSGPENTVAACGDTFDNDGDGHRDCNDFDCCDVVSCGPETSCGREPDGGGTTNMACEGPAAPENTPDACSDGCNNDHDMDTFADCNDFDCCDHRADCPADTACGSRPGRCEGDPVPENTISACTNGCSDDDNEFVDCNDFSCCWVLAEAVARGVPGVEACAATSACGDFMPPEGGMLCADDDLDSPPEPENSLERCSDGCSNERGRFQDCGNFDCCAIIERAVDEGVAGAVACGATTACATMWMPREGVELCAGDDGTGEPPEESTTDACSNECDDDRDGFEDCNDRDCCSTRSDCPATTTCGMAAP